MLPFPVTPSAVYPFLRTCTTLSSPRSLLSLRSYPLTPPPVFISLHLHDFEQPLLEREVGDDELGGVAEGGVQQATQGLVGVKGDL